MKKVLLTIFILILIPILVLFWINTPFRYSIQGKTELKRNKVARSVEVLEEGYKKYPKNSGLGFSLAKSYLQLDEVDKANRLVIRENLHETLKDDSDFQDFLIELAEENKKYGNTKISRYFAIQYLKSHNNNEATTRSIKNYISLGQLLEDSSIEIWEKAYNIATLIKDEERRQSITALLLPKYIKASELLKSEEDFDSALTTLSKAEQIGENAEINFLKAKIYADLERFKLAEDEYSKALQLEPNNNEIKISYAETLKKYSDTTKDKKKKAQILEKAKLLLANTKNSNKRTNLLNKLMKRDSSYNIQYGNLFLKNIGNYFYPTVKFRLRDTPIEDEKNYKVTFFTVDRKEIDTYESTLDKNNFDSLIEVSSKVSVLPGQIIHAKLFVENKFIKEF